jgi:hypothetical protein
MLAVGDPACSLHDFYAIVQITVSTASPRRRGKV